MLAIICCHCRQRLDIALGWSVARCPRCGLDPATQPDDDEPPEDDDPTDEWEVGTGADDGRTNVTEGD